MNTILLLNTSGQGLRAAQLREELCSHYFSHLLLGKSTIGTF